MASPYSLLDTLRWPYYFLFPSTRREVALEMQPAANRFFADDAGDGPSLVFLGDVMGMAGDEVPACCESLRRLLREADLIIGNCEAPLTDKRLDPHARYLHNFSMPKAYLQNFLTSWNIDAARCLFSIANNHLGDRGIEGVKDTRRHFESLGVATVGIRDSVDPPLHLRELRGVRVGVAAWTQWMNSRIDDAALRVLRSHHLLDVDWHLVKTRQALHALIGSPHWGLEFHHFPSAENVALAQGLAQRGFDLLVGHHPHVVQPIARFGEMLCHFSVGNVFGRTIRWPHRLLSVLKVKLGGVGPRAGQVVAYECLPLVQLGCGKDVRIAALHELEPAARRTYEARWALLFGA